MPSEEKKSHIGQKFQEGGGLGSNLTLKMSLKKFNEPIRLEFDFLSFTYLAPAG